VMFLAVLKSPFGVTRRLTTITYKASTSCDFVWCNVPCLIPIEWRTWNKIPFSYKPTVIQEHLAKGRLTAWKLLLQHTCEFNSALLRKFLQYCEWF
jgi:hypothetical protein